MRNGYKYRGWFWMALCAVSVVALVVNLILHRNVYTYAYISSIIICAAGILYHRRLRQPNWEKAYGVVDERELEIRARGAGITLKIMGVVMYGAALFIGYGPVTWALLASVFVGLAVYFFVMLWLERKM